MARPHLEKHPCTSDGRPNGSYVDVVPISYFMTSWNPLESAGPMANGKNGQKSTLVGSQYSTSVRSIAGIDTTPSGKISGTIRQSSDVIFLKSSGYTNLEKPGCIPHRLNVGVRACITGISMWNRKTRWHLLMVNTSLDHIYLPGTHNHHWHAAAYLYRPRIPFELVISRTFEMGFSRSMPCYGLFVDVTLASSCCSIIMMLRPTYICGP